MPVHGPSSSLLFCVGLPGFTHYLCSYDNSIFSLVLTSPICDIIIPFSAYLTVSHGGLTGTWAFKTKLFFAPYKHSCPHLPTQLMAPPQLASQTPLMAFLLSPSLPLWRQMASNPFTSTQHLISTHLSIFMAFSTVQKSSPLHLNKCNRATEQLLEQETAIFPLPKRPFCGFPLLLGWEPTLPSSEIYPLPAFRLSRRVPHSAHP